MESVETVCTAASDLGVEALHGLAALIDQSLLRQEEGTDGEPRFVMLETIREYALEQLEQSGESVMLQQRHADYYLALVEQAERDLFGADQLAALRRIEADHANVLAAFHWFRAQHQVEAALRLTAHWDHLDPYEATLSAKARSGSKRPWPSATRRFVMGTVVKPIWRHAPEC